MNNIVKEVEQEGANYRMKLNKNKCEALSTHPNADIHFVDGTKIIIENEAKHIGCDINDKANYDREINKIIATAMQILNRLYMFGLHSSVQSESKCKL